MWTDLPTRRKLAAALEKSPGCHPFASNTQTNLPTALPCLTVWWPSKRVACSCCQTWYRTKFSKGMSRVASSRATFMFAPKFL